MRTAELLQVAIVECLRAKTGSIDPAASKLLKLSVFRRGARAAISRIQLDCRLRAIQHLESIADRFQNLFDLRRRKSRRSAATQVDRIDIARLLNFSPSGDFANDCVNVARGQFAFVHARGKVAVRATRTTEWNVYVDSSWCHHFEIIDAGEAHRLTRPLFLCAFRFS